MKVLCSVIRCRVAYTSVVYKKSIISRNPYLTRKCSDTQSDNTSQLHLYDTLVFITDCHVTISDL